MNDKIYIHEFIDIIGHNRASYMHHMTANWSPIAQEERNQLCYGVWGVVGTTGRWPEVVNMWEEDGFDGLRRRRSATSCHARTCRTRSSRGGGRRRPAIGAAASTGCWSRRRGPAPSTELCADGVAGTAYAHEMFRVAAGTAADFLVAGAHEQPSTPTPRTGGSSSARGAPRCTTTPSACSSGRSPRGSSGPSWRRRSTIGRPEDWREIVRERTTGFERILMMDAPLCPLKIGRQPARADRADDWDEARPTSWETLRRRRPSAGGRAPR